jgi:hypothetical protein
MYKYIIYIYRTGERKKTPVIVRGESLKDLSGKRPSTTFSIGPFILDIIMVWPEWLESQIQDPE